MKELGFSKKITNRPALFDGYGNETPLYTLEEAENILITSKQCIHEWVSSVAYKGAKICAKCSKIV